jgi:autotransporter-associated beta strand protein
MIITNSSAAKVGTTSVKAIASATSDFRQFLCYSDITVSFIISGSVGLIKKGVGNLTLTGLNTFTGGTILPGGRLSLGDGGTMGRLTATSAITNNSNLTINRSDAFSQATDLGLDVPITGTGTFTKAGTGTTTLTATNTYTGVTTIKNGKLVLDGAANRLPITSVVVVGDTSTAGKLVLGGTAVTNQILTDLTTTGLGGSVVGGYTANSTLTLNIAVNNDFGGTLGGTGASENNLAITKTGVGTLTLSNTGSTFTGQLLVDAGTVQVTKLENTGTASSTGAGTASIRLGGTATATLEYIGSNDSFTNRLIQVGNNAVNAFGATILNNSPLDTPLTNPATPPSGKLVFTGSNFIAPASSAATTARVLTLGGSYTEQVNEIQGLIIDNNAAAISLIKIGASTWKLTGNNTYSGGTTINAGTLSISNNSALGSGAVTVNTGGTLQYYASPALNRNLTLNGGALSQYDTTFSGPITLAANSIIYADGGNFSTSTISGAVSGAGGLTHNGPARAGATRLTGANTYTGPTVINNGALIVKSSLYGNDTSKWTPANITVASNAVLGMSVGGAGEFTMTQAATMFTNLTSNVNNNGMRPNSFMSLDTRNAPAGIYTYSAILKDSTGGGGAVNFSLFGTTTTTLELTGANTYSGVTMVRNNGTLRVSSLNSVFTNPTLGTVHSASSSLGAPTTVDNGTIRLGESGWNGNTFPGTTYQSGNLTYTGTGETTDRKLFLGGYSGNASTRTYTIDQSGTGLLKFTSNFDQQITNTNNSLILAGSTTGTGEISGVITQNTGTVVGTYDTRVTKEGTGTWTLSGANTYTGLTRINGGLLIVPKTNGAVTATATFSQTTLSVSFNTAPSIGQTFTFFAGPTFNTYGSVSLTGATGRSATYNSTTSTLTIL